MNITELVQSPRWKKFMGYVYGWGASVVLIGALFKIQHYPYAGELLTVGMTVEAIIFFFSAFEPPHEQPDWSLVYPELIGLEPRERAGGGVQVEGLEQLQSLLEKMSVEPDKISNLSQGLAKLTNAADNLSNLSEAAVVTNGYIQSLQSASESVGQFSNKYAESTQELAENSSSFNGSMESLNNNLSSLNAVYELQLKQGNEQMNNSKTVHEDLDKVLETLTATLQNAQAYKKETEQLNENLAALNTIYGNMLSAMDVKKKN
jgi:gliding motility-associated protein GldL